MCEQFSYLFISVPFYYLFTASNVLYYENYDLQNVITPIDWEKLEHLLTESNYDRKKTEFLVQGFKHGFSIGYQGDKNVRQCAPNLVLCVGTQTDLWNKVMKEVKLKCYAGPFETIPYDNFIQSPIGLIPKEGGKDTRLIFHLSYLRDSTVSTSVNANTPRDQCRVKYKDFDSAIRRCLEEGKSCKLSKSDVSSAFRNLGVLPEHWR